MQDQFKRQIEYMRISITDRCNLRCQYCMPHQGIDWIPHDQILTYEELLRVMRISTSLGFKRFRVTGGEPLVRAGVLNFLKQASQIPGVEDLMITTNGILLGDMAQDLKEAGVDRVNISLDTFDEEKFREITRGGEIKKVLKGIEESLRVGLNPVKVNVVVVRGFNSHELPRFMELARDNPLHVRFIELMPIGISSDKRSEFVPIDEMKEILGLEGAKPIDIPGGGPANYVTSDGFKGSIGFISAISKHFCNTCNRVRLTPDGKLRPCLHSPKETNLRDILRSGKSDDEIREILTQVIQQKPAEHHMNDEAWQDTRIMSQIGG